MIKTVEGHFCKNQSPEDAVIFDLLNSELRNSFHALLEVTLHAARIRKQKTFLRLLFEVTLLTRFLKQAEDPCEKYAIVIPPHEVRKVSGLKNKISLPNRCNRQI